MCVPVCARTHTGHRCAVTMLLTPGHRASDARVARGPSVTFVTCLSFVCERLAVARLALRLVTMPKSFALYTL